MAAAQRSLDIHTHAMPMPVLEWLAESGLADLTEAATGIVRLDPDLSGVGGGAPLPLAQTQHDAEARLVEMDAIGVQHHAVSLPPFLFASMCTDGDLVREVVHRGNDALAEYCAAAPDRLHPLGTIPMGWSFAADEAQRCMDELGMRGLAIGSRGAGRELDDPVNDGVWQFAHDRSAFVFLHPSGVPDGHRMTDFWLPQLVGYPMETGLAGARLAFGGVLERFDFPLCMAHGGGCLPGLRGRLDLGWNRKAVAHSTPEPPSAYVRRLYFDTAVFSDVLLRHLVEDLGADRFLLGTDFPFELSDIDPFGTLAGAGVDAIDVTAMQGETAARLLGLAL
jgi:aminocarboxymuconate-semialdehyde decarboxylase